MQLLWQLREQDENEGTWLVVLRREGGALEIVRALVVGMQ